MPLTVPRSSHSHRIIVALDVATATEARQIIKHLSGKVFTFKVGSQLFTSIGPEIIQEIQDTGAKVFLDLKYHDIPNTVRRAVESAVNLNVDMLTIHLSGGRAMCEAAIIGRGVARTLLLGVTILTHMTDNDLTEIGYRSTVSGGVLLLAELAKHAGLTGLVASS
ncbi:MAG: orotidine-5'-phosphate decarboxylase, partial [Verrucomicrobia bacterium]|nr:orotidine-5'-phosphate decarboxylase [Verrucomicrobiota bacterium]